MELHLTTEQEAHLSEIATHQGTTVDALVTDIALGLLEENDHDREIIRQRIADADRGEFMEQEEMDARVAKMQPGEHVISEYLSAKGATTYQPRPKA